MADRSASEGPWPSPARYLSVVVLLLAGSVSLRLGGAAVWGAPLVVLVVLPVMEMLWPEVHEAPVPSRAAAGWRYQATPALLALHQVWLVGSFLAVCATRSDPPWVLAGMITTLGMALGGIGLNVAHDLGHRPHRGAQRVALGLLSLMLYGHWRIEHTRGHHHRVGTPEDPATSRRGETLYAFALRSALGGMRSAWQSEAERLHRQDRSPWSLSNEVLAVWLLQAALVVAVGALAGPRALLLWLMACAVAILLTESVNYTQHYGLTRRKGPDGRWEPAGPALSWCSDRVLSRTIFLELPRHGDHHSHPLRPYGALEHTPSSPSSPLGLLGQIVMSLFPPVWFRVMNPRLDRLTRGTSPSAAL